jgi:hypothetical protein
MEVSLAVLELLYAGRQTGIAKPVGVFLHFFIVIVPKMHRVVKVKFY